MSEPKKFVSDDPDLEAEPFPIEVEYRKFTGAEDPETGVRPSERVTDTFHFRPFVNVGVLVWIDAMRGRKVTTDDATPLFDLFDAAIVPADAGRFRAVINGSDAFIDGSTLGSIAGYLYEMYTARPTRPPAGT